MVEIPTSVPGMVDPSDLLSRAGQMPAPATAPAAPPAVAAPAAPPAAAQPHRGMSAEEAAIANAEEQRMRGGYVPLAPGTTTSGVPLAGPAPESEFAVLRELLIEFGLESIYDQVRGFVTEESSGAEITLALRKMPEYQDRFKAIFQREEAGLPPITAVDVLNYEQKTAELFSYYGYPMNPGENLQDMAAELLVNDVSDIELQERLTSQMAFARQVLDDPDNQGYGQQLLNLGATLFDVANFALDPTNTLEQVQRRLTAAEVANESSYTGFNTTADEALELARQGVTADQARQGFGVLRQQSQVVDRLVGDTDDPVSRQQELAALSGDVEAQAAIERSGQRRVAAMSAGGSWATDEEGFAGLR